MIVVLALALVALVVLVFVGRRSQPLRTARPMAAALLSLMAAFGAIIATFRGAWMVTLILVFLSALIAIGGVGRGGGSGAMTPAEARAILGVGPGASAAEIDAAFRRLMLRAHPDVGGSAGLAAQLNAARACLIKKS